MASAKAFIDKYLNQQDLMNELMVALSTFWMVLYSGIVFSKEDIVFFGKIEMILVLIFSLFNLLIIIVSTVLNNKKIVIFAFNLINHKYN